ncbi:MAG: sulfate adenylyltransferase subunit CysN [Methylococcaceae bacterium]|nr:sulfate adenylyltransferase subunit CysN [Methylococcaceae bacterium]
MSHQSELISSDILEYLAQHERKELLRFLTCGSVDDGKSTLIGRLLYDSKMIYEDQLAAIRSDSSKFGTTGDDFDPALLTDGLKAEREQGITIDVAYRYFSTAKRKFIIADTPGHEQYTRNMATGASTCDLAIILIDARYGVQTQTKRHSFIVSLLGIKHVVVAVNKMDLVDYSQSVFDQIKRDYLAFVASLDLHDIRFLPMSALKGENVGNRSGLMPWFDGQPLMELLDSIEIAEDQNFADVRFPVQCVNRPNLDFRGFSGTLAAGVLRKGDAVMALPSRKTSRVKAIVTYEGELQQAFPPQAITVTLEDEIDVSRGDMLVRPDNLPQVATRFNADVVWMTENPMVPGKQYYLKQTTKTVNASFARILHRIDVNTLDQHPAEQLKLNEIGRCEVTLNAPISFDAYGICKGTGSFIVIDRLTNVTVGAGMIRGLAEGREELHKVTDAERAARFGQRPFTLWLTGEKAAEAALQLERALFDLGHASYVLNRTEHAAHAALIAGHVNRAGLICLCAVGTPPSEDGTHVLLDTADFCLDEGLGKIGRFLTAEAEPVEEYSI